MVKTGISEGNTKGYAVESNGFSQLAMTPESKGLIGLFQGQTECKKNKFGEPKIAIKLVFLNLYKFIKTTEVKNNFF